MARRFAGRLALALPAAAVWLAALNTFPALAQQAVVDAPMYDLETLGVPQFVNTNYIDLQKITALSKFRSEDGHDYSDNLEFSTQAVRDAAGKVESCRSMKHYFMYPDAAAEIYAPVSGTISYYVDDSGLGMQVQIEADAQPSFFFQMFHVVPGTALAVGQHVDEGQPLGHHYGAPLVASDMAVFVKTTKGQHLISYFETLTAAGFAPFKARGIASPSDLIVTKEQRDAAPFQCNGISFVNVTSPPDLDYVHLTGGAPTQIITSDPTPLFVHLTDPPFTVSATASSGLPVTITTGTPAVCTISGNKVTPLTTGQCQIDYTQPGNAGLFGAVAQRFTVIVAGLNAGPIYASSQTGSESFLRFYNSGTAAGTVTATLSDAATGKALGTWTSPVIAPGSEQQFAIATLEGAIPAATAKPAFYALLVVPNMSGTFQHVLYRPLDGTLTNLSTCNIGGGADPATLIGVHSSLLGANGFPSAVIVNNTGAKPAAVALGIYDARDGAKLGTFTTAMISANGKAVLDVGSIEAGIGLKPSGGLLHYVIKADDSFTGFLQHLVTSQNTGVVTDMTSICTLDGSDRGYAAPPLNSGLLFSSAQASQSYLRFYNIAGLSAGTVTVTFSDYVSGQPLGQWTSPSIAGGSEQQFAVAAVETAMGLTGAKPAYYSATLRSTFNGYFQHVLWHGPDGTLTNLSTCDAGVGSEVYLLLTGVHSSLLGNLGYPSTIAVTNISGVPLQFPLYVTDARTGRNIGNYFPPAIPAGGVLQVPVKTLESALNIKPAGDLYHYNISSFIQAGTSANSTRAQPGYLQHLVTNQQTGVISDMSTACFMHP